MKKSADIGVIVGRFQVHDLHDAHLGLINAVRERHKKVILFLGVPATLSTRNNPLDFVSRKSMVQEKFPDLTILSLPDMASDEKWSKLLDARIREVASVGSVLLYGGRESFIQYYFGAFETEDLGTLASTSGTAMRLEISHLVKPTVDFRAGAIYAAYNQYPKVYPTVDIAIFKGNQLLLVRKPSEDLFRFPGGFSDPTDESFEQAARREVMEETALEVGDLIYLGSARIDDWRYRREIDKPISLFFKTDVLFGTVKAQDDIAEAKFFDFAAVTPEMIVAEHRPLFELLRKKH
jgi:bifunctional NMN adenylyltransferase/nudix hydrolase